MATKKQTTSPETPASGDLQIPVPAVAKATTKKAAVTKKTTTEKPAEPVAAASETPVKAATPAKKKAAAPKAATPTESAVSTKVYGQIQTSNGNYYIEKGSIPEGKLQLEFTKDSQLSSRIPSYSGQFVTILGEFSKKKKADGSATFLLRNIASHDEIGRRAYELSHENPSAVEDNWFKAENELLKQ